MAVFDDEAVEKAFELFGDADSDDDDAPAPAPPGDGDSEDETAALPPDIDAQVVLLGPIEEASDGAVGGGRGLVAARDLPAPRQRFIR